MVVGHPDLRQGRPLRVAPVWGAAIAGTVSGRGDGAATWIVVGRMRPSRHPAGFRCRCWRAAASIPVDLARPARRRALGAKRAGATKSAWRHIRGTAGRQGGGRSTWADDDNYLSHQRLFGRLAQRCGASGIAPVGSTRTLGHSKRAVLRAGAAIPSAGALTGRAALPVRPLMAGSAFDAGAGGAFPGRRSGTHRERGPAGNRIFSKARRFSAKRSRSYLRETGARRGVWGPGGGGGLGGLFFFFLSWGGGLGGGGGV